MAWSQKKKTHAHTLDSNQCEPFILCFSKAFSTGTNYNPPQLYGPAERERESVPQWQITCTFFTVRSRSLAFSDPQTLPSFPQRVMSPPVPLCALS